MRNGISFQKSRPTEWFSGLAVLSGTSKHTVTDLYCSVLSAYLTHVQPGYCLSVGCLSGSEGLCTAGCIGSGVFTIQSHPVS